MKFILLPQIQGASRETHNIYFAMNQEELISDTQLLSRGLKAM